MSGAQSVKVALETRLAAMSGVLPTAYENVEFVSSSGVAYQKTSLILATPTNDEWGSRYIENGYFQINLCYSANEGQGEASSMAQNLRDWFYRGLFLAAGDVTVTINKTAKIAPSFLSDDRYVTPVQIFFTATKT